MEKIQPTPKTPTPWTDKKRVELLAPVPFEPITLARPMKLFKGALSLTPGRTAAPDPEFLVFVLTGCRSHQAYIRQKLGDRPYRNLANCLRGKHRSSPTTRQRLSQELKLPPAVLNALAHGRADGPLVPLLLKLFQLAESLPMQASFAILSTDVPCPCCGNNVIDDAEHWWRFQTVRLGEPEYRFAERILSALLGVFLLLGMVPSEADVESDSKFVSDLAHSSRHPIGHWLAEVQAALRCPSLSALADKMHSDGPENLVFRYGRIRKWSAGDELMPVAAAQALAEATREVVSFRRRYLVARTLAFVTDFVMAAVRGNAEPARTDVQEIVHQRLLKLVGNLSLASRALQGHKLRPVSGAARLDHGHDAAGRAGRGAGA